MKLLSILALLVFVFVPLTPQAYTSYKALENGLVNKVKAQNKDYNLLSEMMHGSLGEGQRKVVSFLLKKNNCYLFAVKTSPSLTNLDIKLVDDKSAYNKKPGTTIPHLLYCAKNDTDVKVDIQALSGQGQFVLGVFSKDKNAPVKISNEKSISRLLKAKEKFAPEMNKIGEFITANLGQRQTRTDTFSLKSARCYKFIAVSGKGITDLNLEVFLKGKDVARDKISGQIPVAGWCSNDAVSVEVKISVYRGSGAYSLGVFEDTKPANRRISKVGGPDSGFIENRIRQFHARFGKGRAAVTSLFKGNLKTGGERIFPVKLTKGHCYTIIGAGNPSVKILDIILIDPRGRETCEDSKKNNFPILETSPCPLISGTYRVKVRMFSGFGQFGLQVFSN